MKEEKRKRLTTVSLEKQNNHSEITEALLSVKERMSTNRDGLLIGTTIMCKTDDGLKKATSCKGGYIMGDKVFSNLSDLTTEAYSRLVYTNPLSLWCTEDGKTLRKHIKEVIE